MPSRPSPWACVRFLVAAALLSACANNVRAPLILELASSSCGVDVPLGDLRYYTLRVCPSEGGSCLALTSPEGEHGEPGSDTYALRRDATGRFTIDARVDRGTLYDVTVYSYQGEESGVCQATGVGRALRVRFGVDTVRVRVHPFDGWSCAGLHEPAVTGGVPRGLHQAVLLPNRQVLVLGGVASAGTPASSANFGNAIGAQTLVEVFDPSDGRFYGVSATDEDGEDGLSRVLFQARYVSTLADGRYEVRLLGGFDPRAVEGGAVGFNAGGILGFSTLFGPVADEAVSSGNGLRADATLLYDPATRTATIARAESAGGGCTTLSASAGAAPRTVCSVDGVAAGMRPTYTLAATWYPPGGAPLATRASRVGATITALSDTQALVWGGGVANAAGVAFLGPAEARAVAGEVVEGPPAATTAIPGHDPAAMTDDGRPWTSAYHGSARIAGPGDVSILFAGGLVLQGSMAPLAVDGRLTTVGNLLTVARFDETGTFVSGVRVSNGTTDLAALLSTVTPLDAESTRLLLVGGAAVDPTPPASTLIGVSTVGIVSYDAGTDTYAFDEGIALTEERWGHTTTVIPGYGVLVHGGMRAVAGTIEVLDRPELLLADDLPGGAPRPSSAPCDMPPDGGVVGVDGGARDGGARDAGTARDAAAPRDAGVADAGPSTDAG